MLLRFDRSDEAKVHFMRCNLFPGHDYRHVFEPQLISADTAQLQKELRILVLVLHLAFLPSWMNVTAMI